MASWRLGFVAAGAFGAVVAVAACGAEGDTTGGGASSAGASNTGGATSSGSGGASSSGTGGSASCSDGEERCVAGQHQICSGTSWQDAPCGPGQGCDDVSGACVDCLCTPGETGSCVDATTIDICADSCLAFEPTSCQPDQGCIGDACVDLLCIPGSVHCVDDNTTEVCNADGTAYDPGPNCGPKEQCHEGDGCLSLCTIYSQTPSSVGCSFFALNMDNFNEGNPDAVVVGNTSSTLTAVVTLFGSPGGVETAIQSNVQIPPLGQHTFTLPNAGSDVIESVSMLRTGGAFRVESDLPVIAYQHSPLQPQATNDASCLLPEATLGKRYFVPSYYDALGGYPSYFNVVATEDNTQVNITVPNPTAAGSGVQALGAGQTTTVTMNRYDTLQVVNASGLSQAQRDVMGAEVDASAPVAVFGAVECAQVPAGYTYCDHMEEQAIPVRNWGTTYVGAHAPQRSGSERYYWRVMAMLDNTTIDTNPPQSGFPVTLNEGQFYEFYTQQSFIFTGSAPFSAIQYISGQNAFGAGTGDPAMVTAVPVEQFLNRYVVLTPSGYSSDYIQIIRTTADDVQVDGNTVPANQYYTVGGYTVADYPVSAGTHVIASNSPFGIMGIGYTGVTSYGYPGGLALNNIAPE